MADPSPSLDGHFKGLDWEECDVFIRKVRSKGWEEGKLNDGRWLAHFASLHMTGTALRWHIRLPLDVQRDWFLLEAALVERWSPPGEVQEDAQAPYPAPAPIFDELTDRSVCGTLKFVADKSDATCYVSEVIGSDGACNLTTDIKKALRLRFGPQSRVYIMELMHGSRYSWLGVHWRNLEPNIGKGCREAAKLSVIDSETLVASFKGKGPFRFAVWDIMHDGGVRISWKTSKSDERIQLSAFIDSWPDLYLTSDADSYSKEFPTERRGRLLFDRLA